MTTAMLDIVPPRRLGGLLADARRSRGEPVERIAARSAFSTGELRDLEGGDGALAETRTDELLAAYSVTLDELVPPRRQVVVDLDRGEVVVAERSTEVADGAEADGVLSAYLSLVYALRSLEPGAQLPLRGHDLAVLARVLDLTETEVRTRLHALMVEPTPDVRHLTRSFRRKLVVPVVGALVVAAAGLVFVLRDGGSDDAGERQDAPVPTRIEQAPPERPPASLIPPASAER